MKQIKLSIAIIFSACLLFACNENSTQTKNNSNNPDNSQASNGDPGKSSFSANLDGISISGGQIDDMQLQNTAFIYPTADNSGKKLLFYLYSDKKGNDSYSFMFSVPDKTGPFTKNFHDDQPFAITLDFLGGDLSRYLAAPVTVNIISITATRVAGTFSGKLSLSSDTPNGTKKEVTVTDGKFDIPFSTGNMRPQ
ncbi:MAG: hypothetical protein ACRDE8_03570 [Ginsengibacter sp.]